MKAEKTETGMMANENRHRDSIACCESILIRFGLADGENTIESARRKNEMRQIRQNAKAIVEQGIRAGLIRR